MWGERIQRCWGALGLLLILTLFSHFQGTEATILMVCASLIHEAGHFLVLRLGGGSIRRFRASAEGMEICADSFAVSYFCEILAVLAGPMANLLAGWLLMQLPLSWPMLRFAAGANLILGLFNLLPATPLDGWRFLQLVSTWVLGPDKCIGISVLGVLSAFFLAGGLALLILISGGNIWLLPTAIAIIVAGITTTYHEL